MDGDSSELSVMGCLMTRRLQLVRKLRDIRLSVLPGVEMTVIGHQSYSVHELGGR